MERLPNEEGTTPSRWIPARCGGVTFLADLMTTRERATREGLIAPFEAIVTLMLGLLAGEQGCSRRTRSGSEGRVQFGQVLLLQIQQFSLSLGDAKTVKYQPTEFHLPS
jgi:hypothetical protein